jgi:hypothetical protein
MNSLTRRHFLRSTGIALGLPLLNHHLPKARAAQATQRVKRMVTINATLGLYPGNLWPSVPGHEFESTPYLEVLKSFRKDMTIFSGVSHPGLQAGHEAEPCFLSAAPMDRSGNFRNSISLDQLAAEKLGAVKRFGSLILTSGRFTGSSSVNRGGVMLPAKNSPSEVFKQLFLEGSKKDMERQVASIEQGRSMLDALLEQSKRLQGKLGVEDRTRMEQYFTSVRELEQRLAESREWARQPKPKVKSKEPVDVKDLDDFVARAGLLFDLTRLAMQTDSTRVIAIQHPNTQFVTSLPGLSTDWHNLTHHGMDPTKLAELKIVELMHMGVIRDFLTKLRETPDQDGTLLDHTSVLFGSHLGNAGKHDCKNLPMMLFGGGYKHAGHLAFDREHNTPAARIFVAMLQRLGIDTDEFASGKGRIPGLELA